MGRTDLGIDHQHRLDRARGDEVGGGLDAEGGRAAGHIHVEGEAVDAEGLLHLDRQGRVGARHVGGGAQDGADLADRLAPGGDGLARSGDGHLGHDRQVFVGTLGDVRGHAGRVEDAGLVEHEARLDARGLLDEFDRGGGQFGDVALEDFGGVVGVEPLRIGIVGGDQLGVGDRLFGGEQAGGGDDGVGQGVLVPITRLPAFAGMTCGASLLEGRPLR